MALDTDDVLNALVDVLTTNTATMSASLTSSNEIKFIKAGDARAVPVEVSQYPGILVKLSREIEEFAQLGARRNNHELEFEIVSLIYSGNDYTIVESDIRKMTKGVKSVLKDNIDLNKTVLWSLPETVDYFPAELEGTYLSASIILFRTRNLST